MIEMLRTNSKGVTEVQGVTGAKAGINIMAVIIRK